MGGNATKAFEVQRLNKADYQMVSQKMLALFQEVFPKEKFHVCQAVRDKMDFGDVDLVTTLKADLYSLFDVFKSEQFTKHGVQFLGYGENVERAVSLLEDQLSGVANLKTLEEETGELSFAFEYQGFCFQLDLMTYAPKYFDFACKYMDYNVLGNLVGRVAFHLGFALGTNGFYQKVYLNEEKNNNTFDKVKLTHYQYKRNCACDVGVGVAKKDFSLNQPELVENQMYDKVLVTTDFEAMLSFLGFDVDKFKQGFDSVEDVALFVMNSKYFHFDFFKEEKMNAKVRKRNLRNAKYQAATKFVYNVMELGMEKANEQGVKVVHSAFVNSEMNYSEYVQNCHTQLHNQLRNYFKGYVLNFTNMTKKLRKERMVHARLKSHNVRPFLSKRFGVKFVSHEEETSFPTVMNDLHFGEFMKMFKTERQKVNFDLERVSNEKFFQFVSNVFVKFTNKQ